MYTLEFIIELYNKYSEDLKRVKEYQKGLYHQIGCGSDDTECEITYMLMRHFKPLTVVEISPNQGWSSCWILHGLKDNGTGKLISYDIIEDSEKKIPIELTSGRWELIVGDVMESLDKIPKNIDYLYIDSDHYCVFTQWYLDNLFPMLRSKTPVCIHDIYHDSHPETYIYEERGLVMKWLRDNNILFFSPSRFWNSEKYEVLQALRNKLGLYNHHGNTINPMIYFLSN